VTITIVADLPLPGPTLASGPKMLVFDARMADVAPTASVVSLRNLGSGLLSWTASADAPWVVLGATAGNAPDSLSVSINPALLPPGATATAHITLIAPGAAASPQTIVVIVQRHDLRLYLPLVRR
jgi:hypothetical protein